ncbi:MAG: GxxExxY protein [Verrucomicrobiota bacterium]
MHPDFTRADRWSPQVIGAAIEVHRDKGSGLLESIFKRCLMHEFSLRGIPAVRELMVPITYKDLTFEEPLRLDLFIDGCLIVEAKAVEKILPIHVAQLLSYMKLLNAPLGLLINFHEPVLKNGIRRITLHGADQP